MPMVGVLDSRGKREDLVLVSRTAVKNVEQRLASSALSSTEKTQPTHEA